MPNDERKLLNGVTPKRYRIVLAPELDGNRIPGSVRLDLEFHESKSCVVLNAAEIDIHSAAVEQDGVTVEARRIEPDADQQAVALYFGAPFTPGAARLFLEFTARVNDRMRGIYRSTQTVDGKPRPLLATQFEAEDARRAFPCLDHPAVKAVFELTLIVPAGRSVLSNTEPLSITDGADGRQTVRFAPTPVMSTYLVAFVVGDFDVIETTTANGVAVRAHTPPGAAEQGRFVLEASRAFVEFYEDYFGIPYPLSKLDLVPIPNFEAGAMENWGLITFREAEMLIDPQGSTAQNRERVAIVAAHETGHMWFGDLCTMKSWGDLWLNEAFASWISYKAVDHLFPDWGLWRHFNVEEMGRALALDSLRSSHPILVAATTPGEVTSIFDEITYSKGASLLRMLEADLGAEPFRQGLGRYLRKHAYGNASTEDLWNALQEATGRPVARFMREWTEQTGYPVVSATPASDGGVCVRQERFLLAGRDDNGEAVSPWNIPLGARTEGPRDTMHVLAETDARLSPERKPRGWVKLNPDQRGLYRVHYSEEIWTGVTEALRSNRAHEGSDFLTASDCAGLVNDAFAFSRSGHAPATRFLDLLSVLRARETDFAVWAEAINALRATEHLVVGRDGHEALRAYARHLYHPAYEHVGWDARSDEGHGTRRLRPLVLDELGRCGDPGVESEALRRFDLATDESASLPADLRATAYGLVAQRRGEEGHQALLELHRATTLSEERKRCLQALGRTLDERLLQRTLSFALTDEVRDQDVIWAVAGVAANPYGHEVAWRFVQENWAEIFERFGEGFLIKRIVGFATENFSTEEKAQEVQSFFAANPPGAAARDVQHSLERIRANVNWLARGGEAIAGWLRAHT